AQRHYHFGANAAEVFRDYLERRIRRPHFANARSVRNALDRARLRQASRLFAERERALSQDDLTTLLPVDLLGSRVFTDAQP
ncbi:MAG: CbbX protein, partial [Metallibacterium sp.]